MAGIQQYQVSSEKPWNKQRVIHLYRRLGFAPTPTQIQNALATNNPVNFIGALLDQIKNRALPTPPIWANYSAADYVDTDNLKFEHRDEFNISFLTDVINDGLRSKTVLFWHNHFVTELNVYDCNKYLWNYYYLLNQYCLGNFKNFVLAIGKCPAMLSYLNGNQNEVGNPNENYARELMELFTMGENNGYTQDDVVEVARALTGWRCNMYDCDDVSFNPAKFDNKPKTIFGKTGNWGYNEVHNLIFTERKNQVARFICGKLYRYFIHKDIDTEFVNALAQVFMDNNWELLPVFKALFRSEHFFDDTIIGSIIKSPLESLVDFTRLSGFSASQMEDRFYIYQYRVGDLGMDLWNPINVAGWQGHHEWINENTLTQRWSFCTDLAYTFANNNNKETLRNLAKSLVGAEINDPQLITYNLIEHYLGKSIDDNLMEAAVLHFKGDIPSNYYDEGNWNLDWEEAPDQISNLIIYLSRLPEFQLS